jgi:hypothetical protein
MEKKLVYIASSYHSNTEWGLVENIRKAEAAAINVWQSGYVAICPHLNTAHFGGLCPDEVWLEGHLLILARCDVIFMVQGWQKSKGATTELEFAKEQGMEIVYDDGISSFKKLYEKAS